MEEVGSRHGGAGVCVVAVCGDACTWAGRERLERKRSSRRVCSCACSRVVLQRGVRVQ